MALTDAEALHRIERVIARVEKVINARGMFVWQADIIDRATGYREIAEIVAGRTQLGTPTRVR